MSARQKGQLQIASTALKEILRLRKNKILKQESKKGTEICKLFKQIPKIETSKISDRVEIEHSELVVALNSLGFQYHFDRKAVDEANETLTDESPIMRGVAVSVLLVQGFAVVVDRRTEEFASVVEMLTRILEVKFEQRKGLPDFSLCISLVFCLVLREIVADTSMLMSDTIVGLVRLHVEMNRDLGLWIWPSFEKFCCCVLTSKREMGEDLMTLLVKLFVEKRVLVSAEKHTDLIDAMEPYVFEFSQVSFRLLSKLSHFGGDKEVVALLGRVPLRLCEVLACSPPVILCEGKGKQCLKCNEILIECDYRAIETPSSFEKGFRFPMEFQSDIGKLLEESLGGNLAPPAKVIFNDIRSMNVPAIEHFLEKFWEAIGTTSSDHFYDFVAVLLRLIVHVQSLNINQETLMKLCRQMLDDDRIFNASQTVFGPDILPKSLANVRLAVFAIMSNKTEILRQYLFDHQFYPLMFAELLMYFKNLNDIFMLEVLVPVSNCCSYLQRMDLREHTPLIEAARSSCFLVLCRLFLETYKSYQQFSLAMKFVFERNVRSSFITLFERSTENAKECSDLTDLFKFLRGAIDGGEFELYWQLVKTTSKIFDRRPYLTEQFPEYFDILISVLELHPETFVLNLAMDLLGYLVNLRPKHIKALSRAIHLHNTPEMFSDITNRLGEQTTMVQKTMGYLIRHPNVLLVVVLCYGFQNRVLKLFLDLAKCSIRNCFLMCDCKVSEYILDLLIGRPVIFKGVQFDIKLADKDRGLLLLQEISKNRISYGAMEKFLQTPEVLKVFGSVIREQLSLRNPCPFGKFKPSFKEPVEGSAMKETFSLSFWLKCDGFALMQNDELLHLISLKDKNGNIFSISLKKLCLEATYTTPAQRTDVTLCPNVFVNGLWNHFVVVFRYAEEPVILETYQNSVKLNDSEFIRFPLTDFMDMEIGWCASPFEELFGFLCNVSLYGKRLVDNEIFYLASSVRARISDPNVGIYHFRSSNYRELSGISAIQCDQFLNKVMCALLSAECRDLMYLLIEMLGFIAIYRPIPFRPIMVWLSKESNFSDAKLYPTISGLVTLIADKSCRFQWLKYILLNIDIWKNYRSFVNIMTWLAEHIPSLYASMLPESEPLLYEIIQQLSSLPTEILPVWADVVIRVCKEHITSNTVATFRNLWEHSDEERIRIYLFVIANVAENLRRINALVSPLVTVILRQLCSADMKLVMDALVAIYKLVDCDFPSHTIIILRALNPSIYEELLATLEHVSGLKYMYSLQCALYLITQRTDLAPLPDDCEKNFDFVFPMLLLCNVQEEQQVLLAQFIARNGYREAMNFYFLFEYFRALFSGRVAISLNAVLERCAIVTSDDNDRINIFLVCLNAILFCVRIESGIHATSISTLAGIEDIISREPWLRYCMPLDQLDYEHPEETQSFPDPDQQQLISLGEEMIRLMSKTAQQRLRSEIDLFRAISVTKQIPTGTRLTKKEFTKRTDFYIQFEKQSKKAIHESICRQMNAFRIAHTDGIPFPIQNCTPWADKLTYITEMELSGYRRSRLLDWNLLPNLIVKTRKFETMWQAPADNNCILHKSNTAEDIPARLSFGKAQINLVYKSKSITLTHDGIAFALKRSPTEIEIYCKDGRSYYLHNIKRELLMQFHELPAGVSWYPSKFWSKWKCNRISAFRFLCMLNAFNKRSANNEANYPVMPPVISDWTNVASPQLRGHVKFTPSTDPVPHVITKDILTDRKTTQKLYRERAEADIKPVSFHWNMPAQPAECVRKHSNAQDSVLRAQCQAHVVSASLYHFCDDINESELPAFAKDKFDFVYKHRKLLQNSSVIPTWSQSMGFMAPSKEVPKPPDASTVMRATDDIQMAVAVGNRDFIVLTDKNEVWSKNYIETAVSGFSVLYQQGSLVLYSPSLQQLQVFTYDKAICMNNIQLAQPFAAVDDWVLVTMLSPSVLSVIPNFDPSRAKPLCLVKSRLEKIVVSSRHRVMVLGCDDGKVRIRCLSTGRKVSTFDLGDDELVEVFITKEMGFILIVTATRFILLSTNGDCIKIRTHNITRATNWHQFAANGLDYVLFLSNDGYLCYFEAFYPEYMYRPKAIDMVAMIYDPTDMAFRLLMRHRRDRDPEIMKLSHTLGSLPTWQDIV